MFICNGCLKEYYINKEDDKTTFKTCILCKKNRECSNIEDDDLVLKGYTGRIESFIKEFENLCNKYKLFIVGSGLIDQDDIYIVHSNNFEKIANGDYDDGTMCYVSKDGYKCRKN